MAATQPTPARVAVARALHGVFGGRRRVPEDWNSALAQEDARLAHALLGLCLRRWGRLQAHVDANLRDPGRDVPLGTRVALAMGLSSLAWLPGVATHAAVDESVRLAGDAHLGFPAHKGLVNAILRKGAREREALGARLEALPADLDRPPFARAILEAALGPARGQDLETLWARLQTPPDLTFSRLGPGDLPEGVHPHPLLDGALKLDEGAPFPGEWLARGEAMVQDLSSQALMAFQWPRPVATILDVCAAPGGKTTALARRFPGAAITALERSPVRARRLEANLLARGVRADVVVADARTWLRNPEEGFELILLDAPCSGSGTLRKHPELAWIGDISDLPRQAALQAELLRLACARLAPGGLLIYSVCSWFPQEGTRHLADLPAGLRQAAIWSGGRGFRPDPLTWPGEGFQGFALAREA